MLDKGRVLHANCWRGLFLIPHGTPKSGVCRAANDNPPSRIVGARNGRFRLALEPEGRVCEAEQNGGRESAPDSMFHFAG